MRLLLVSNGSSNFLDDCGRYLVEENHINAHKLACPTEINEDLEALEISAKDEIKTHLALEDVDVAKIGN